jgi:phosphoglycolate phosphatase-like HAD superfamily hydrolase
VLFDLDGALLDSLEGIALAIAEKLASAPENIIYLGDTDVDMQTACARKIFDQPGDVFSFIWISETSCLLTLRCAYPKIGLH